MYSAGKALLITENLGIAPTGRRHADCENPRVRRSLTVYPAKPSAAVVQSWRLEPPAPTNDLLDTQVVVVARKDHLSLVSFRLGRELFLQPLGHGVGRPGSTGVVPVSEHRIDASNVEDLADLMLIRPCKLHMPECLRVQAE